MFVGLGSVPSPHMLPPRFLAHTGTVRELANESNRPDDTIGLWPTKRKNRRRSPTNAVVAARHKSIGCVGRSGKYIDGPATQIRLPRRTVLRRQLHPTPGRGYRSEAVTSPTPAASTVSVDFARRRTRFFGTKSLTPVWTWSIIRSYGEDSRD